MKVRAIARLRPWGKEVEIALVQGATEETYQDGDVIWIAKPVEMQRYEQFTEPEPCFTLPPIAVQSLMDDLWRCGYRPSEGEGSAGQLASVKYHLEDMRKLVFNKKEG